MNTLEAVNSTALRRTTVHHQFNGRAFGVPILDKLAPIVLNIRIPGYQFQRSVLMFDKVTRKDIPYEDLGELQKCCIKVYAFNIRHYLKCYINGGDTGPYTFNECKRCGVGITDDSGHAISQKNHRKYRRDRFIYQSCGVLQEDTGSGEIFDYQERAINAC